MRIDLSAEAEADLVRIYAFNLERGLAWADRVENRLLKRTEALLITPFIGRALRERGLRRISTTDIQYVIDYRPTETVIEILRFRHTREVR